MRSLLLVISFVFALIGCGGGGGNLSKEKRTAIALLGNLADAKVEIYEMSSNGKFTLKWTETTSDATNLEDIGKFNSHANELDSNKFYLYKVVGGKDWDKNDDGIKDNNYTLHTGVIRAFAKGSDIKEAGNSFKVTILSEILYQKIEDYLNQNYTTKEIESKINKYSSSIIDGNIKDVITFDPKDQMERLNKDTKILVDYILKSHYPNIIDGISNILKNKIIVSIGNEAVLTTAFYNKSNKNYILVAYKGRVEIYDITDIKNPQYISKFDFKEATKIAIKNDYAFVIGVDKFMIVSLNNINNPKILSKLKVEDTLASLFDIAVTNNLSRAYLATGFRKLVIVDISDIYHPRFLQSYDTKGYTGALELSNDNTKLYIMNFASGIKILDIRNDNISVISSYKLDTIFSMEVSNEKIFAGTRDGKIVLINLNNLQTIKTVSLYNTTRLMPISNIISEVNIVLNKTKIYFVDPNGLETLEFDQNNIYSNKKTLNVLCNKVSDLDMDNSGKLFVSTNCNLKVINPN